jgi:hypothetical protein
MEAVRLLAAMAAAPGNFSKHRGLLTLACFFIFEIDPGKEKAMSRLTACRFAVLVTAASYLSLFGCRYETDSKAPPAQEVAVEHDHEHGHLGPHDGDIIELGNEQYHAELVHDEDENRITIYLLDAEMKNPVPIEAEEVVINITAEGDTQQFKLPALPLEGEPAGQSSRFELVDEELLALVESIPDVAARLNVTIAGESFVGDIEHHHDHVHGHGHAHEGNDDHEDEEGHEDEDHEEGAATY